MNKYMEDKRTMFAAVLSLLTASRAKLAAIPGFPEALDSFQLLLEKIDAKAKEKDEATAGKTLTKHTSEQILIRAMMKTSSALFLLARKTHNIELKEKSTLLESTLTRMRDTNLAIEGEALLGLAKEQAQQLTAYGVIPEEITELEKKIIAYRDALGKSVSSVSERIGARISLETLMKEADEFLAEEIGRYMERLRENEPEMYAAYSDATYIRLTGIRHEKAVPAASAQTVPASV
jgi:hypothetical protein